MKDDTPPQKPAIGVGVVVLRRSSDGEAEAVLIRRGQPPRDGQWSIPGGKQEYGETVREAARREVREETGLEIEIVGLIDVLDLIDPDGGYHYTLVDFAARAVGGVLRAGSDAADARWVPLDEAAALVDWDETRRILWQSEDLL